MSLPDAGPVQRASARCFVCSDPLSPGRRIGMTGRVDGRRTTERRRPERGDVTIRMHPPCASYLAAQIMIALHAGWTAGEESLAEALPSLQAHVVDEAGLTPRELRVLEGITEGLTNAEIARRTGLAGKTVKNVVSRVLFKLGAAAHTEAAVVALQRGLASYPQRGV